eukprot:c28293_g1_i1.p3 GENE.c28293_g1_i1~~c28293_g1_i1.p3  ORF type:complete len:100 (+),score=8.46 c28293_g1_i1:189-488(+)
MLISGVAELGVGAEQVIWPMLVQRREASTRWRVLRCYNCGQDMLAISPSASSVKVVVDMQVPEERAAAIRASETYSSIFHFARSTGAHGRRLGAQRERG